MQRALVVGLLSALLALPVLGEAGYSPIMSAAELRQVLESGWPIGAAKSDDKLKLHLERNQEALQSPRGEGAILTLALRGLWRRQQPESVDDLLTALHLAGKEPRLEKRLELQRALLRGWVTWVDGPHRPEDLLAAARQLARQRVGHSELLLQVTQDLAAAKKRLAAVCQTPSEARSDNEQLLNRMRSAQRDQIFERVSRLSANYIAAIETVLKDGDSAQFEALQKSLEEARKPLRGFSVPSADALALRLAAENFPDCRQQIESVRWTRALLSGALFLTRAGAKGTVPRRPPVDPFGKTMTVRRGSDSLSVVARGPQQSPVQLEIAWPPERPQKAAPRQKPEPYETPAGSRDDGPPSVDLKDPEAKENE